jgi:23S rRNA (guanosine2251-2'-O)-methyltransferase
MPRPSREYLYGINPAFEVIRAGKRRVYEAYFSESSRRNPRIQKLEKRCRESDIPLEWVEKGRILQLAKSKDNQGVVLKTEPFPYLASDTLLEKERLLLLDNVEDPHNVGALLRCAEVFGFRDVLLTSRGTPDIYPSVVKVSAGASEFLNIARDGTANRYMKSALDRGFTVVALDAKGPDDLRAVRKEEFEKLLLVVGGEDKSVGQFILNQAHHVISIPQQGRVNSLNASVAAGIAMYELA